MLEAACGLLSVVLGQLGQKGHFFPCKTLLKFSVKKVLFLFYTMFTSLFNKYRAKSFVGTGTIDGHQRQTDETHSTDRQQRQTVNYKLQRDGG